MRDFLEFRGASGGLRSLTRCNRDQRRLLHYRCRKRGGDGASHDDWCGASGDARWYPTGREQKPDDTMKQKLENFSVSYIESIGASAIAQCRLGKIRRA